MPTLLMKLAGPLQSWGDSSRFNQRKTRTEPTKSGVLGLLAAACGRRRSDPIEDLLELRFGVRTDQPGKLLRDFQTEIDWRTGKSKPLTYRYYLEDAVFVAGVEGPEQLIDGLYEALLRPTFPLYLGRRSCPPSERVLIGMRETDLDVALRAEPWHAANWYRKKQPPTVRLPISRDAKPGEEVHEVVRDLPLSFNMENRQYSWREVVNEYTAPIENPGSRQARHDPFELLGGMNVSKQN